MKKNNLQSQKVMRSPLIRMDKHRLDNHLKGTYVHFVGCVSERKPRDQGHGGKWEWIPQILLAHESSWPVGINLLEKGTVNSPGVLPPKKSWPWAKLLVPLNTYLTCILCSWRILCLPSLICFKFYKDHIYSSVRFSFGKPLHNPTSSTWH